MSKKRKIMKAREITKLLKEFDDLDCIPDGSPEPLADFFEEEINTILDENPDWKFYGVGCFEIIKEEYNGEEREFAHALFLFKT